MPHIPDPNLVKSYFIDQNNEKIKVGVYNNKNQLEIKIYQNNNIFFLALGKDNFEKYNFQTISEFQGNKKIHIMIYDQFYSLLINALEDFQPIQQKYSKYFCEYDDVTNYIYVENKEKDIAILAFGYLDDNGRDNPVISVDIKIEFYKISNSGD